MKRMIAVLLSVFILFGLSACKQEEPKPIREEDIQQICELATLKCFYNNVAKIDKEASNIFQVDRKMWIEYTGIATIGIKMSDVIITVDENAVSIKLPEAEILGLDYQFDDEKTYYASGDNWLIKNEISTEEQQAAVVEAQKKMEEMILANKDLFIQAKARAKELIENYINKMGEVTGVDYTVCWEN